MARNNTSYCGENANRVQKSENENVKDIEVSSLRIIGSQCLAVFPICFVKIRLGMGTGFTTLLLAELTKNKTEINATLEELTWFSSYCFVRPVAAIIGGCVGQYVGARRLLLISFLLYILADLLFHWANSILIILLAQAISGFTSSSIKGTSNSYVAEVLQPKFRSVALAIVSSFVLFGKFFALLLGNFIYWRTQVFVSLVFPVIGFVFIHFVPDSPLWLANKNRFVDAEKSLARLRGWTTPGSVKTELYSSTMNTSDSLSPTEISTTEENTNSTSGIKLKNTLSLFLDRSFYIPLLTIAVVFFISEFNGAKGLSLFSILIFEEIKSPIDGHIASTILSVLDIASAFIFTFTVPYLGRRKLSLASAVIMTVCLTIAVIFLYLTNSNLLTSEVYLWIISVSLLSFSFAHFLGVGKIIHFLNSELFPQKLRYVGAGCGYFIGDVTTAVFNKSFLYIVKAITFPGTLIFFIIVNIASFIVFYFIIPETEGVTLRQIEEHYLGTKKLKNKH